MSKIKEIIIENPYGFIYITTNMVNGKKYIGQRMFDNKSKWMSYLGSGIHLVRSIQKYGKDNLTRKIIAIAYSKEELNQLEIATIDVHNAVENNDYYNIAFGGDGGFIICNRNYVYSEEHKQKISMSLRGRTLSEEHVQKIVNSNKGKHRSAEFKIKMRELSIGKIMSKDARQKMSEAKKGHRASKETKHKMSEAKIKLSNEQIIKIREKYLTGEFTYKKLANIYEVSKTTINSILNYKNAYKL